MTLATHPSAPAAERVVVLVPTCDAGPRWADFLQALAAQQPQWRTVVIDSESVDGSAEQAQAAGLTVQRIARAQFNHGTTRQQALERHAADADWVVFMTQDAVLAEPQAIARLLQAFDDPRVAAAYGRQLPHPEATPIAAHARLFNYPARSETRTLQDAPRLGLKTCFLSNSFAAYRVQALREVGGFASDLILAEDMHLAARLLQAGHAVRYQADALVYHSHNYSLVEEFQRYFGGAGREGLKFLLSEMRHLLRHAPWRLPEAAVRTVLKALAYHLGRGHARLPRAWRQPLSLHKGFWA